MRGENDAEFGTFQFNSFPGILCEPLQQAFKIGRLAFGTQEPGREWRETARGGLPARAGRPRWRGAFDLGGWAARSNMGRLRQLPGLAATWAKRTPFSPALGTSRGRERVLPSRAGATTERELFLVLR